MLPAGVVFAIAVASLYTALELAPLSIVAPLAGTEPLATYFFILLILRGQEFITLRATLGALLIVLGVVNIIYAALTSFAQRNLKRKIAYSSISHMGFVLIGIGSFSALGTSGAMLQMISHGLISAALFLSVGVLYDRVHSRLINSYGGIISVIPKYSFLMVLFSN